MFERLTESSRAVLSEAQAVAMDMGVPFIAAGHLLYGCASVDDETAGTPLRECGVTTESIRRLLPHSTPFPSGVDTDALRAIGVDYDHVRRAVDGTFGPGALDGATDRRNRTSTLHQPSFTPEAKRALETSLRVTLELRQKRIAPGHLLLAMIRLYGDFIVEVIDDADRQVASLAAAVLTQLTSDT